MVSCAAAGTVARRWKRRGGRARLPARGLVLASQHSKTQPVRRHSTAVDTAGTDNLKRCTRSAWPDTEETSRCARASSVRVPGGGPRGNAARSTVRAEHAHKHEESGEHACAWRGRLTWMLRMIETGSGQANLTSGLANSTAEYLRSGWCFSQSFPTSYTLFSCASMLRTFDFWIRSGSLRQPVPWWTQRSILPLQRSAALSVRGECVATTRHRELSTRHVVLNTVGKPRDRPVAAPRCGRGGWRALQQRACCGPRQRVRPRVRRRTARVA